MIKNISNVNSSVLNAVIYDSKRQDLILEFKGNRKSYNYTPVSNEFFEKFKKSKSKGHFFNKNIKNNPALTKMRIL